MKGPLELDVPERALDLLRELKGPDGASFDQARREHPAFVHLLLSPIRLQGFWAPSNASEIASLHARIAKITADMRSLQFEIANLPREWIGYHDEAAKNTGGLSTIEFLEELFEYRDFLEGLLHLHVQYFGEEAKNTGGGRENYRASIGAASLAMIYELSTGEPPKVTTPSRSQASSRFYDLVTNCFEELEIDASTEHYANHGRLRLEGYKTRGPNGELSPWEEMLAFSQRLRSNRG